MTEGNEHQRQRWSPYGRRGAAGTMGADAILVGGWIDNPAHATRYVDLCAAYRALAQEGMADRLFDAGTDLDASLTRHPHIEHLASVRIMFNDHGTTVTLGEDEPPPPGKRHVEQLYAVLTLRKGSDPPRTMRVPADIAFLGDRSEDGFVLARSSRITPEQATDAVMDIFGAEIEIEAAANGEEEPERPRDTIEEEAVRILEDEDAATLRRIHNITRRRIKPIMPAERGVWIEVDADGHIQARFR